MAIDEDHLRDILATAIRNASSDPDECVEDEDACMRLHPIHNAGSTDNVGDTIYAEVDSLVDVIIATLKHDAFCFRPFIARSGWTPWRSA
jgi:hypothetical protein